MPSTSKDSEAPAPINRKRDWIMTGWIFATLAVIGSLISIVKPKHNEESALPSKVPGKAGLAVKDAPEDKRVRGTLDGLLNNWLSVEKMDELARKGVKDKILDKAVKLYWTLNELNNHAGPQVVDDTFYNTNADKLTREIEELGLSQDDANKVRDNINAFTTPMQLQSIKHLDVKKTNNGPIR